MLLPTRRDLRLAIADVVNGLAAWHIWSLLGITDIRQRYRRSRVGQFWLTLSTGIFVGGIGIVYAYLFRQPIQEFIPYLAVNIVVWNLISSVVVEGTNAFTESSVYLRQEAMPKTIFVMRVLVRNLIAFAHNLVIVPIVFLVFGVAPSPIALLAIPGLAIFLVAAFLLTLSCGVVCTRFRDLPQIVANLMQLAFFVTPVMWRIDQMGEAAYYVVGLNPFAALLRIVAEPIRGQVPGLATYGSAFVLIGILLLLTWPLFARFRARIVYWL